MFVKDLDEGPTQPPTPLRRCGRCDSWRPLDDFNWRRKEKGQRDNYCRPCRAAYKHEHYAANRARYIAQAQLNKQAVSRERTAYLIGYFAEHPCVDCGQTDPVVLDFDHLREKRFNISAGVRDHSWSDVLDEIEKCDVVCANCHRRRTARRAGYLRSLMSSETDAFRDGLL